MIPTDRNFSTPADPLFDYGATAAATKANAFTDAKPKLNQRQQAILDFLNERGNIGATRHEIADALEFPLSSSCGPVLGLLREQLVIESGTRLSPFGSPAAVVKIARDGTGG